MQKKLKQALPKAAMNNYRLRQRLMPEFERCYGSYLEVLIIITIVCLVFFNDANKLMADGKYTVTWAFNYTPNVDDWRAGVVSALTEYSAGKGDWAAVENAFVAGWEQQWQKQNG